MSVDKDRLQVVLELIQRMAAGDLDIKAPMLAHGDELDAVAAGLVMLAEEMSAQMDANRVLHNELLSARERTIAAQQQAIVELSTPVLQVWKGILIMPLVGVIDTARAKDMTDRLLEEIAARQASVVLIDITGVPVVDSGVAQHLLLTIRAVKLLGAKCMLTGVSPAVAQTLVTLGINLSEVITKGSLQSGLAHALRDAA
jgi:rsbT co-antagonist protein RsbR